MRFTSLSVLPVWEHLREIVRSIASRVCARTDMASVRGDTVARVRVAHGPRRRGTRTGNELVELIGSQQHGASTDLCVWEAARTVAVSELDRSLRPKPSGLPVPSPCCSAYATIYGD